MTPAIISRDDAAAQGLKRYFTGEPCKKRGHISERFVANGGCIQCMQRLTPQKTQGPKGRNVGWPRFGLVFEIQPRPLPEEMEAAFRYVEAMRWHDYAVQELRKDPALMAKFMVPKTPEELAKMEADLMREQRIRTANLKRVQEV